MGMHACMCARAHVMLQHVVLAEVLSPGLFWLCHGFPGTAGLALPLITRVLRFLSPLLGKALLQAGDWEITCCFTLLLAAAPGSTTNSSTHFGQRRQLLCHWAQWVFRVSMFGPSLNGQGLSQGPAQSLLGCMVAIAQLCKRALHARLNSWISDGLPWKRVPDPEVKGARRSFAGALCDQHLPQSAIRRIRLSVT